VLLNHDILWLDVPMHDILTLEIINGLQQLFHDTADGHVALDHQVDLDPLVQLSTVVELANDVERLRVLVEFVHTHYVRVVQLFQDYYFQELYEIVLG
jgi:hypothetical protein